MDIAIILCTSGTTGKSKGAVHTHRSFLHQILSVPFFMPFPEEKSTLLLSKGTHISGSLFPLGAMMMNRTVLVMGKITKEKLFQGVDKYKPGLIFGFPTFLLSMVNDPDAKNYDFRSVELVSSGGASITPSIENSLMKLPNLKAVLVVSLSPTFFY